MKKIVDQIATKNLENCVEESWQETVDRISYLLNYPISTLIAEIKV